MRFELSDEQQAIKRTAREFLAARYSSEERRRLAEDERGFTDEQWRAIVELAWPAVAICEQRGGPGLGVLELALIQEELGYALAPAPLYSTVSAALVLGAAEPGGTSRSQEDETLPRLAAGELRGCLALWDEGASGSPRHGSRVEARNGHLSARKVAVADAGTADVIVIGGDPERVFVVDRHAPGVAVTPAPGLDPTRKLFTVTLHDAPARAIEVDRELLDLAYDAIEIALAAESVGVAQRAMEMAVQYAKERHQFGRPIGTYQAVSHRCAQMLLEVEGARSLTYFAAWAQDAQPETRPLAASMAKAYAGDAGWRVPASAIQVHGGIGFTWEHDLHLFLRRGRSNAQAFGDRDWHQDRIMELAAP